ncbi:MAG: cell wall hydrolase [Patescibacteria group bacterium]
MENKNLKLISETLSKWLISGVVTLLAFSTNITMLANHAAIAATTNGVDTFISGDVNDEVLWLARAVYSESKRAEEQALVAWVIRNRVESTFFPDTYRDVVLQRGQFSGMHATDAQYWTNISLDYDDESPAWDTALSIARAVYFADAVLRPLPATVLHFYSPMSMLGTPSWAKDLSPVHSVRDGESVRFAFFANVM